MNFPPFNKNMPISLFSKPMQFMPIPEMAAALKEIGYDGVDLTIRTDGHISPANVESELPLAVNQIREAGLEVFTVVTEIMKADEKAERVIKAISDIGIRQYRLGFIPLKGGAAILSELDQLKGTIRDLATLNKKYRVQGVIQNHSGMRLGGSVWDIWYVMKETDPRWIAIQYDPMHASIEGKRSWVNTFYLIKDRISSVNVKDYYWKKDGESWKLNIVPLSEGMVELDNFFKLLKVNNLKVPVSIHIEYPLGGAEHGLKTISIPKNEILGHVKRDLLTCRHFIQQNNL